MWGHRWVALNPRANMVLLSYLELILYRDMWEMSLY